MSHRERGLITHLAGHSDSLPLTKKIRRGETDKDQHELRASPVSSLKTTGRMIVVRHALQKHAAISIKWLR